MNVETDFTMAVLFVFFLFWMQNGWHRVDCTIGVQKACELIASEKDYVEAGK